MEDLWTDAGLDPRMNVYRCMTTDTKGNIHMRRPRWVTPKASVVREVA